MTNQDRMTHQDRAGRPTLILAAHPRPSLQWEGLKIAGRVVVCSVLSACVLALAVLIGLFAAILADLILR